MNIGITNILYLAFRLAPFIIVSFFTLQSLLNWDLKGIIYLVGLIFACVISVLFGNSGLIKSEKSGDLPNPRCNVITLGQNGPITNIPLSLTTFSYTFFYLLVFIINLANTRNPKGGLLGNKGFTYANINMVLQQNFPTLVLFPTLIILEIFWVVSNKCIVGMNVIPSILGAIVIGGLVGVFWAIFITTTKRPELQYINKPGLEVCNQPSKSLYRCRPLNSKGTKSV
jgi:hypothetical protein